MMLLTMWKKPFWMKVLMSRCFRSWDRYIILLLTNLNSLNAKYQFQWLILFGTCLTLLWCLIIFVVLLLNFEIIVLEVNYYNRSLLVLYHGKKNWCLSHGCNLNHSINDNVVVSNKRQWHNINFWIRQFWTTLVVVTVVYFILWCMHIFIFVVYAKLNANSSREAICMCIFKPMQWALSLA